jgi:hippurate hydrolase
MLLVGALCASPGLAASPVADAVKADYDRQLARLFVDFHKNPELSFKENRTAKIMAQQLRAAGATVTEGVGGTGVVGVMKNGAGPVVLVRANGRAAVGGEIRPSLCVQSQADRRRRRRGAGHARLRARRAHHLDGRARAAPRRDEGPLEGTVPVHRQPAEERVGGAQAMIADGLYTRFPKPDYALAFHVASEPADGKVSAGRGIQYSSADSVDIIVHGVGAHGASPNSGKDPVYIGSQIVVAMQGIIGRSASR